MDGTDSNRVDGGEGYGGGEGYDKRKEVFVTTPRGEALTSMW